MVGYAKRVCLFLVVLVPLVVFGPAAGSAGDWPLQQSAHLLPAPPGGDIGFGSVVALDGNTLAVAGRWRNEEFETQEAVYVFGRGPAGWTQQAILTTDDDRASRGFGATLALQGDVLVVGAPLAAAEGFGISEIGAVYVFLRQNGVWTESARLSVIDEPIDYPAEWFGHSLALDGDTLLIGAKQVDEAIDNTRQVVYVFTREGNTWRRETRLELGPSGEEVDQSRVIALSGDTALVGMPGNPFDDPPVPGLVYVFRRVAGEWSPAGAFAPDDSSPGDLFGCALALEGDTAAAVSCGFNAALHVAETHVFVRQGEAWTQQAALDPQDEDDQPLSVKTVALDGDSLALGAPYVNTTAPVSGAAYVYRRDGATWTYQKRLVADDAGPDDRFGFGLDAGGGVIVAGAPLYTHLNYAAQGAVYLFEPQPERPYTTHLPLLLGPAFLPPGLIVYRDLDANFLGDIYTIRPDGTGKRNLTQTDTWQEYSPVWSPDGARIAYVRADKGNAHRALMIMDADGKGRQVIVGDDPRLSGAPAWSPDGWRIAFSGYDEEFGPDIYAVDVDSGQITNLTAHLPGSPSDSAWSPDGTRLAFTYLHETETFLTVDIAVMEVAGGKATLLTDDPNDEGEAHWSPDGQRVLYTDYVEGMPVLTTVPAAGGASRRVMESGSRGRWSPDGSHIIFEGWGGGLFRIEADGSDLGVIDGTLYAAMGDWQP